MLYDRYARDLSKELFDSVYDDLYSMAARDNAERWRAAKRKRDYRPGEHQAALSAFCDGKLSLGGALDYIKAHQPAPMQ